jgi:hypothetical protein
MTRSNLGVGRTWRRREFLTVAAAAAAGLLRGSRTSAAVADGVVIDEPFDGAVLNRRHGEEGPAGLKIRVSGRVSQGWQVTVAGAAARVEAGRFAADVVLREAETEIAAVAVGNDGRRESRVRVVWDRNSRPRYRVAIDDNSFFLRDIFQQRYNSLFDCFYLKMLHDLHNQYGAKFVLNIYYTTGDEFELSRFPDRYRSQWQDNADWLKLAFHAHADQPARPYQDAPPEHVLRDFDKVAEQIVRFAGEPTYSPTTVIHWGMVRPETLRPLYERGVRALSGYFRRNRDGAWDINYRLDETRSEYLSRHDAWKDFDSGIVFSKIDIVINSTPLEQIVPTLQPLTDKPETAEIMDLLTHEQYFWPFYRNHLPDHAERMEAAVRWVTEHGYEPVFFHQGLLGV